MRLNDDFSQRVVVRPDDYLWVDSPMPGVERMMLDRVGGEVARATSLVRYAPSSTFAHHVHGGGEEFLVLEGEFGDEHGTYPKGTYVRNPVGTAHSPHVGEQGCVIFVKLQQFAHDDRAQFAFDTAAGAFEPGAAPGTGILRLHEYGTERVELIRWAPGTASAAQYRPGGEELLVLEGTLYNEEGEYPAGTWIRNPQGTGEALSARDEGALAFVKTGHLC